MKKLLLITTALAAVADPAHAGPVAAAVTWVGGILAGGGVAAFAMNMAFSIGLSAISGALMGKPERPATSVSFDVQMGDDLPLSFVVGDYATAGKRKYIDSWGRNTRFVTEVIETSAIPQGFAGMWVDDERGRLVAGRRGYVSPETAPSRTKEVSEGASVPSGAIDVGQPLENRASPEARIWIKWVSGAQAADPLLTWAFGGDADYPWTGSHIGRGKSYAIVTTRHDDDTLTSYPAFLFEPAPLTMYDVRFDSTNGGSGSQRWGDRSTWQPSLNPAVIAYNVARGVYYNSEWVYGGKSLPAWRLPSSEWIAAANACDASRNRAGGGTEPAYRCGMEISVDVEPARVLEEIGKAANMRFAEVGGRLKPIVDLPGAAVFSFTDADILITEGQSFRPFYSASETYNAISATYPERAEKWANRDAPAYIDAAATADDGGRYLPISMDYAAVPFSGQVQRLMRAQMRDYRRMRRHEFHLPPDAYALEPGIDLVSYSSDRNGYINKLFMVERVTKTPGMNVLVSLREVDPSDYDWSADFELPTVVTPPVNPQPFVQPIAGLVVDGAILFDEESNARRPAIRVACDGDEVGVTHIQIQRRVSGATQVITEPQRPFVAPFEWFLENVLPDTLYEVRARLLSRFTPRSEWSGWIPVRTPDIRLGGGDIGEGIFDLIHLAPNLITFIEENGGTAADDAAAAEAARDAAQAAAGNAQTAAALADQARQDAEASVTAADGAGALAAAEALKAVNAAGAAAGSATSASASADAAGVQAVAAHGTAVAAQTSAGQAQVYRNEAASSANTADGAAASAALSSGVSVNAAQRVLPADLREGARYWTTAASGSPETIASPATGANITINADGTITFPSTATATTVFVTKGVLPYRPDRTYRVTAEVRARGAVPPANRLRAAVRRVSDAYVNVNAIAGGDLTPTAVDVWQVRTADVTTNVNAASVWARIGVQDGPVGTPAADIDVRVISTSDVTDTLAAAGSASAAAGSAATAATRATEAGQASSAALASQTAAGTSAGNAAGSAASAASAAQTAVDNAGVATNAAQAAQASSITATSAAAVVVPARIAPEFWSALGSPGFSLNAQNVLTVAATGVGGPFILPVAGLPFVEGNTYKITVRARSLGGVSNVSRFRAYRRTDDAAGAQVSATNFGSLTPTVADQWQNLSQTWKASAQAGGATQKLGINVSGSMTPAFPTEFAWIRFEDVTASVESAASATAAAGSASTANTAATNAGQSAVAANSSQVSAQTAATQAGQSAITAATAATDAEGSSASAYQAVELAARAMGGGVSPNPIFQNWINNSQPVGYQVETAGASTITRTTTAWQNKYSQSALLSVNSDTPTADGPVLRLEAVDFGYASNNPAAVYVTAEIMRVLGGANGAIIRAVWTGTNTVSVSYPLKDRLPWRKSATVQFVAERPADFTPGSSPRFYVDIIGTSTRDGARENTQFSVHRLDYQEVTRDAAVVEWQRAKVSLEGIASSVIGFRARAGTAGAELELAALSNPSGPTVSVARIAADRIILDGTVDTRSLTNGATSETLISSTSGYTHSSPGNYQSVCSLVVSVPAGYGPFDVIVFVTGYLNPDGGHRVVVGGTVVETLTLGDNAIRYKTMQAHGTIGAGNNTIAYQVSANGSHSIKMTAIVLKA